VRRTPARAFPPEVWEILTAAVLLSWRIRSLPISTLWHDWVTVMAVFWIFTALAARTRAWPAVLGVLMAFLSALYFFHQVPQSLALLGSLR